MKNRRAMAQDAGQCGPGREMPITLYRHTTNWRFVDKYRNGNAISRRNRQLAKCPGRTELIDSHQFPLFLCSTLTGQ